MTVTQWTINDEALIDDNASNQNDRCNVLLRLNENGEREEGGHLYRWEFLWQ